MYACILFSKFKNKNLCVENKYHRCTYSTIRADRTWQHFMRFAHAQFRRKHDIPVNIDCTMKHPDFPKKWWYSQLFLGTEKLTFILLIPKRWSEFCELRGTFTHNVITRLPSFVTTKWILFSARWASWHASKTTQAYIWMAIHLNSLYRMSARLKALTVTR